MPTISRRLKPYSPKRARSWFKIRFLSLGLRCFQGFTLSELVFKFLLKNNISERTVDVPLIESRIYDQPEPILTLPLAGGLKRRDGLT